jgi:hypothetical protein
MADACTRSISAGGNLAIGLQAILVASGSVAADEDDDD